MKRFLGSENDHFKRLSGYHSIDPSPNPEKANPHRLAFFCPLHPLVPVVTCGSNVKHKPLDNGVMGWRRNDKLA
jgi:hypothetical protein